MQESNIDTVKEKLFSTDPPSQKMNDEIRNSLNKMREQRLRRLKPSHFEGQEDTISDEEYQKIAELADFISEHVRESGKEQTILDFQAGLNLLNDYKKESIIESKIQLKEDGDFGKKTLAALFDILQNYPVDVVKRFVKLGAINNRIWNTKNNPMVDTDKIVLQVTEKLDERGY